MRVLITGGRNFDNHELLETTLDAVHASAPLSVLIHGAANGADTLAGEWASRNGIEVVACPADWKRYGRAAGPIRNRAMFDLAPDLLVAFPGGKGTADMISAAEQKEIPIRHA
ncbi:DUF2493 domain-containing protein [Rubinisphaera brasiliensis]|uniref:YspA cpYpsA-related SLOG domain-containing protein n=1 Tax=Rubinisphaera brasiliensis (strain ATCC 49424 / DSM 5305 / JCM 21570 / IAM 15109 / NBRC 103401 / IFAM 1448) TaxID=756272 RepID=F0SJ70_RUBBR|nr:DUF2493 domain-containing protein [Rubinisphaera brasiliensis]ADY58612.1 Protein of unknown function DUF2493 [Rubinisphaera brasiliensis DSM 5305]